MNGATATEGRGLGWGALAGALLVVALGLALRPQGRGEPPLQAWSDTPPATGHPAVVRPPADVRTQGTASSACPADAEAAPPARRGT